MLSATGLSLLNCFYQKYKFKTITITKEIEHKKKDEDYILEVSDKLDIIHISNERNLSPLENFTGFSMLGPFYLFLGDCVNESNKTLINGKTIYKNVNFENASVDIIYFEEIVRRLNSDQLVDHLKVKHKITSLTFPAIKPNYNNNNFQLYSVWKPIKINSPYYIGMNKNSAKYISRSLLSTKYHIRNPKEHYIVTGFLVLFTILLSPMSFDGKNRNKKKKKDKNL